jgi:soluble lytic murein transglycosylase-like protein
MTPKLLVALLVATHAFAGEYAILTSGFSMRIDRHEAQGSVMRVFLNGGSLDLPAATVVRFEPEISAEPQRPAAETKPEVSPHQLVDEVAQRWNLPPAFLHSIVKAESGYRADAVSPKGAIGLMQLMPGTARELGADPTDPRQNLEAGARYLSELLLKYLHDDFQVRKAIAAYNAGPGAVSRYQGVPPYRETQEYVERVIRQWQPRKDAAK